jgi:tetratricopeptide (TPR) repeat protein
MRVAESLTMSVLRTAVATRMPSPEAYDATLRGRALRQQGTEASLGRAQEYFEQAIRLDPAYAPAYAGLADVFHLLGGPGLEIERPRELLVKAQAAARRALELDPRLAHGYAVRGLTRLWLDGDVAGAETDIRRAISLNASFALAHQYLSTVLVVSGRREEAILSAHRAIQLDPLTPSSGTTYAYRLYYGARLAEALAEFDRALEGSPDYVPAWLGKAQTLRALGRAPESRRALDEADRRSGGRTYVRAYLGYAMGTDGDREGARAIQAELTALGSTRYVSPFHFALAAAGVGDAAEVRRQVARLTEDGSGWAVFVPIERELQPFLAVASSSPR